MSTKQQIEENIKKHNNEIKELQHQIEIYEKSLKRLNSEDVLPIGTRVRLKTNWNTKQNMEKLSGWASFLHFMNPSNLATIKDVECYEDVLYYLIKFDDQTCYVNFNNTSNSHIVGNCFSFKEDEIEVVNEDDIKQDINFEASMEEAFFKTFEIQPNHIYWATTKEQAEINKKIQQDEEHKYNYYPIITFDILLKLIVLNNKGLQNKLMGDTGFYMTSPTSLFATDMESLKNEILQMSIENKNGIKQQVQDLFKGKF